MVFLMLFVIYGSLLQVLRDAHGTISPTALIQLLGVVQTGDLQSIVYDLAVSSIIYQSMYLTIARYVTTSVQQTGPDEELCMFHDHTP